MTDNHINTLPLPTNAKFIDLTGKRFNDLYVLGYIGSTNRKTFWLCECECGNTCRIRADYFSSRNPKDCGCSRKERSEAWKNPLHSVWSGMMQRCYYSKGKSYPFYGGRGIRVCYRWHNLVNFLIDVSPRPTTKLTLDRIENDGHYSCGKCSECFTHNWPANWQWGTRKEQADNRRSNVWITIDGRTQNAQQWAIERGLKVNNIYRRIHRGWTPEQAVTIPVIKQK